MYHENIKKHRNLLEVAAFVIFPTSIMVLCEIYRKFEGHFLNELRVSFNDSGQLHSRIKKKVIVASKSYFYFFVWYFQKHNFKPYVKSVCS